MAKNYLKSVCSEDISRIDGVQRDEKTAAMIMRSYARNISTVAKKTSMLSDVTSSGEVSCSSDTFDDYVKALDKLSTPKRSFCDPSVAVAALGLSPDILMTQLKTFGFLFEQMCVRDLRAYTMDQDSHISYYRDRYGLEADIVLHLSDGRYALIECKLGSREIEEGAAHLLELKQLIKKHNESERQNPLREPDLLVIITGGQMAYTRPDGVKIIPLGCLKD